MRVPCLLSIHQLVCLTTLNSTVGHTYIYLAASPCLVRLLPFIASDIWQIYGTDSTQFCIKLFNTFTFGRGARGILNFLLGQTVALYCLTIVLGLVCVKPFQTQQLVSTVDFYCFTMASAPAQKHDDLVSHRPLPPFHQEDQTENTPKPYIFSRAPISSYRNSKCHFVQLSKALN